MSNARRGGGTAVARLPRPLTRGLVVARDPWHHPAMERRFGAALARSASVIVLGLLNGCGGRQSAAAGKLAGPPQVQLNAVPASIKSSPPAPALPSTERSLAELEERVQARFPDQQGKFVAIETGMHVTDVMDADVDAAETFAVSVSQDKTARVWSLLDGKQLAVLRVPGAGSAGQLFAVAVAPRGDLVAVGGYEGGVYVF